MKDIHELINELGARLNEEEKYDAMMILNQMYLDGYDDVFICIALIKIVVRDDFERNKYLFAYQPFLDEVKTLRDKFKKVELLSKDFKICAIYDSSGDVLNDNDRALIEEYGELCNMYEDEEVKNNYLDYLYMKYCFSYSEILDCNIKAYKKIIHGTNEGGKRVFS